MGSWASKYVCKLVSDGTLCRAIKYKMMCILCWTRSAENTIGMTLSGRILLMRKPHSSTVHNGFRCCFVCCVLLCMFPGQARVICACQGCTWYTVRSCHLEDKTNYLRTSCLVSLHVSGTAVSAGLVWPAAHAAFQSHFHVALAIFTVCILDTSDLRYTSPRMHWFAEPSEMPGS